MVKKFVLVSNSLGFDICPEPEDEIEQRLTVNDRGQVRLSRFCYGMTGAKYPLLEKVSFCITSSDASCIMKAVTDYFESDHRIDVVTDIGEWRLKLTDDKGLEQSFSGPLCQDLTINDVSISSLLRSKLRRNDLLAFDGNPADY